jgi:hypothetical protein
LAKSGINVRDISITKGIVKAVIEKGGAAPAPVARAGNDKTLVVFSGDLDKEIASSSSLTAPLPWTAR